MSLIGAEVAARLAAAQQAGSPSGLLTPEAAAGALSLLREAAPGPGQDIDTHALADVCLTFFLRGQAGSAEQGAAGAVPPDLVVAALVGGLIFERAPQLLPGPLRDHLASASDPLREARFAYVAAMAHADGIPGEEAAPGATGSAGLEALDRALEWSSSACQALAGRGGAAEAADAMVQRMTLLTSRFRLAADLGALEEAARVGLKVTESLAPGNPAHAACLRPATEAVVRSALVLGSPPGDEAERAVAALPPGIATEAAGEMLDMLRAIRAEPVTWPGESDARRGLMLTAEGTRTGHPGLLTAAESRLRAALARTPPEHPARAGLTSALGAVLLSLGGQRTDAGAVREGMDLLNQGGRLFRLLAAQLSGPGVPAETSAAAAVLDLLAGAAREDPGWEAAVGGEWRPEFAAAVRLLPAGHPGRAPYDTLLAAVTDDPGRAASAVLAAAVQIDWARLAAGLRGAGQENQAALALAGAFDGVAGNLGELGGGAALPDGLGALDLGAFGSDGDDRDARIERLRGMLAADGAAGSAGLSAGPRAILAGMLGVLIAERGATLGDPAALREAAEVISRSRGQAGDHGMDSGIAGAFGLTLMLSMLTDPARWLSSEPMWDQETRLAIAALLAARPRRDAGDGQDADGKPDIGEAAAALGELLMTGLALSGDSEVPQPGRLRDLGQRIAAMASRQDPAAGEQVTAMVETLLTAMSGMVQTLEAIPHDRAAESHAETIAGVRQRIEELPPGHPVRGALRPTLAGLLAGQAFYLRDTDPAQARELLAEATALAEAAHPAEPVAMMLRQYLDYTRAVLEHPGQARIPGQPPGTSVREVYDRLHRAGNTPEAIREVLADEQVPAWLRVNAGFGAAFRLAAELRVEAALECAERATELLAAITDRGADSASAEHALASLAGGMPATCVSAVLAMLHAQGGSQALTGPLVDRVAVLAERSRGLLLARQLEGRTDLGELRSARPDLAGQFEALTGQLAAGPDALAALRPGDSPPASGRAEWARLAKFRASGELDALIARIRAEDGDLSDFLRPLTASRLRGLASAGPVVLLSYPAMPQRQPAAPVGPFALVVTSQEITSVRLATEAAEVAEAARRWTEAIAAISSRGSERPGPAGLRQAAARVTEILSWTWHRVTGPVLRAAGLPAPGIGEAGPGGAEWPRIWWIPDGPFHALPLHAAQCPGPGCELGGPEGDGCGAALDAVASSYVPGFRTLAHARRRAAGSEAAAGRPLIVTVTDGELPGAEAAAREAAGRLGAGEPLIGQAATSAAVTAALADVSFAHFGCHAASDPAEPSGGVLYLPGGEQLTVREICQSRPRAARLAFLTACSTARTSQRLASEAIHLSSAFLIAGFSEAVGTLWEIDSQDAGQLTMRFYQRITSRPPEEAAAALHHCVRALRRERPGAPHIWAAYVHAGA